MILKFVKVVLFFVVFVGVLALSGCAPMQFTCSHGEFGPKARLTSLDVDEELVHNLSSLCAKEVADGRSTEGERFRADVEARLKSG